MPDPITLHVCDRGYFVAFGYRSSRAPEAFRVGPFFSDGLSAALAAREARLRLARGVVPFGGML